MRFSLFLFGLAASALAAPLPIPDSVVFERDLEFANPDNQHLQVNLARPKAAAEACPAVVCIHGGGFRAGKRESYDPLCAKLAERGYVAMTVTYRLAPQYPFPAAVVDCKAAVRWLRAHAAKYGVDPQRVAVLGGSAGGHLSLFLGVTGGVKLFEDGENLEQSSAVQCVVDFFGPSDFTKSYGKSVDAAEVLPLFFGGDLTTKWHEHIMGSPLFWVTPLAPPTLCLHGTVDDHVALEQSTWMVDKLKAAGVEAELVTYEGGGHGLKGEFAEPSEKAAIEFLDKHLK